MKIGVAGSGAMGCGFGYLLKKAGNEVVLMDYWPEHIEAIRKKGLTVTVNGEEGNLPIEIGKPEEIQEKFDLVFVFTKSMGLRNMLEAIRHTLSEDTKIVSLLNGLGHAQTISEYVPKKNIMMGTTVWTAGIDAPGKTHLVGNGPVELQNSDPSEQEAALQIVQVLQEAGLNGVYSEDVHFTTWRKACVNGTMNSLCALLDCTIAELLDTSQIEQLLTEVVTEFSQTAEAENVQIDVAETVQYIQMASAKVGSHYPSMHQDIKNKRPTEVDFLTGAVDRMAAEEGREAPYSRLLTQLIHTKEDVLGIQR